MKGTASHSEAIMAQDLWFLTKTPKKTMGTSEPYYAWEGDVTMASFKSLCHGFSERDARQPLYSKRSIIDICGKRIRDSIVNMENVRHAVSILADG